MSETSYEYILFIDEAGDDNLNSVRPIDPKGSSEWLVISGLLVRAKYETELDAWLQDIRKDVNSLQSSTLHFRKLSPKKRLRSCELLATHHCRAFAICSNKKNMRQHRNKRAEKVGTTQYFYNYCVRLLMERVTEFCFDENQKTQLIAGISKSFSVRGVVILTAKPKLTGRN